MQNNPKQCPILQELSDIIEDNNLPPLVFQRIMSLHWQLLTLPIADTKQSYGGRLRACQGGQVVVRSYPVIYI